MFSPELYPRPMRLYRARGKRGGRVIIVSRMVVVRRTIGGRGGQTCSQMDPSSKELKEITFPFWSPASRTAFRTSIGRPTRRKTNASTPEGRIKNSRSHNSRVKQTVRGERNGRKRCYKRTVAAQTARACRDEKQKNEETRAKRTYHSVTSTNINITRFTRSANSQCRLRVDLKRPALATYGYTERREFQKAGGRQPRKTMQTPALTTTAAIHAITTNRKNAWKKTEAYNLACGMHYSRGSALVRNLSARGLSMARWK